MNPPIVLLTDFGLTDSYVGCLKGVILGIYPEARIIDLCHGILPQDIQQGASVLEKACPYFPSGSIFVCVVDPGVGTSRHPIAVRTSRYYFVGPDNGLLSLALRHEKKIQIRKIKNKRYFLKVRPSSTFHGRDIFAPVGAWLARGGETLFQKLGPRLRAPAQLAAPPVRKVGALLEGCILYFDHFGNVITNIDFSLCTALRWRKASVKIGDANLGSIRKTYASAPGLVALFNSFDQLEIAYPNGSARREGNFNVGDPVTISFRP